MGRTVVTCRAPLPLVAHRSSLIIFSVTSFAWFSTIGTFSLMSSSPCMRAVGSDQCVQSVHTPVTASRGCAPRIQSESRILRVHAVYGKSRRPRVRVPREAACGTERGGMRYTRGSKTGDLVLDLHRYPTRVPLASNGGDSPRKRVRERDDQTKS